MAGTGVTAFLTRYESVVSIVGKKLEAPRAKAATADDVRAFLELYDATQQRFNISLDSTYNMDETSVALGVCTNTRVIASSLNKKAYVTSPETREWVSILDCVSATARKLHCAVVFKG